MFEQPLPACPDQVNKWQQITPKSISTTAKCMIHLLALFIIYPCGNIGSWCGTQQLGDAEVWEAVCESVPGMLSGFYFLYIHFYEAIEKFGRENWHWE